MFGEQKLELRSGFWLFAMLFIWFGWIGAYTTHRLFLIIDQTFNTAFARSGLWLNLGVFGLTSLFISIVLFFDKYWKWDFKFDYQRAIMTIVIGYFCIILLSIFTNYLMSLFRENAIPTNQVGVNAIGRESKLGQIILTMFFAPFVEELLFRLGMIKVFSSSRFGLIFGLIISSLYFGFVHIDQALYAGNYIELIWLIYYGGAGLVFGLVYVYNKNIIPAILLHFLLNSGVLW